MTTHLVTFSDASMSRSAELCYLSGCQNGIDIAHLSAPDSVRRLPCYEANRKLFDAPRGCGYWAWKPALLNQIMGEDAFVQNVREGDVVVYADAGVEFLNNVNYIIDRMDQPLFLFANQWEHAHWCKADIIANVWPGSTWADYGKQCQASVIFIKVCDYSRAFTQEWLHWCLFEGGRLIDDSPSTIPNHNEFAENRWDQAILSTIAVREHIALHWWPASYGEGSSIYPRNAPEFKENRHDQAILTTMAAREGIKHHPWAAMYNSGTPAQFEFRAEGYADDYPTLFSHHRRRNWEYQDAAIAI